MHVILQTGSQLHAHRLKLYLSSPRLQAFPSSKGFCTAAEELGIRESDHRGPCLVLLSNCKISAEDFNHHIRSTFLRGYIVRVYWCEHKGSSKAECISHLHTLLSKWKGYCTIQQVDSGRPEFISAGDNEEVEKTEPFTAAASVKRKFGLQPPYNSNTHGCSYQECLTTAPNQTWTFTDVKVGEHRMKLRLQTYPRELVDSLVDVLTEVDCQPHGFSHSLHAVHVGGIYRYGITSGDHMYLAPSDREDLAKGSISRASLKLQETLQVLGFDLHPDMIAMDLGASPGAWTQHLSKHIKRVIAVDPALLHKQVLQPNVTHIRKMAQDATDELLIACSEGNGLDLLVCDVNRHPVEAAQVLSPMLPYLHKGGLVVLTLKFHGRGRDKELKVDEIKGIFKESLSNMDCIWLLANSTYERTFVGIKI